MDNLSHVLARLKAGDQTAWEPLVRCQAARLLAIAWSITGDQHRAEDVLQEVFLRLARGGVERIRSGCEEAFLARKSSSYGRPSFFSIFPVIDWRRDPSFSQGSFRSDARRRGRFSTV
jgi:hypothetical protein